MFKVSNSSVRKCGESYQKNQIQTDKQHKIIKNFFCYFIFMSEPIDREKVSR